MNCDVICNFKITANDSLNGNPRKWEKIESEETCPQIPANEWSRNGLHQQTYAKYDFHQFL